MRRLKECLAGGLDSKMDEGFFGMKFTGGLTGNNFNRRLPNDRVWETKPLTGVTWSTIHIYSLCVRS